MNQKPIVTADDAQVVLLGSSIAAASLFSASDPDGNPITKYRFLDASGSPTSGYFTLNGVVQTAGLLFTINAADLVDVEYHAGSIVGKENIQIQAFDGIVWSDVALIAMHSAVANTSAPIVAASNIPVVAYEEVALTGLVSASDPDGWPIIRYQFRDRATNPNSGFFELNGVAQAQNTWFFVEADQFTSLRYVGALNGQSELVDIKAFDGVTWSSVKTVSAITSNNNNRPVVQPASHTFVENVSVPIETLFTYTDADGNTIKKYRFLDASSGAGSGFVTRAGIVQPSGTWIEVPVENLASVSYTTADHASTEQLRVRVWDGKHWSTIQNIFINTQVRAAVETPRSRWIEDLERIEAPDLFSKSDAGPAHTKYQIYDGSITNPNPVLDLTGKFWQGETILPSLTVLEFTPAQLAEIEYESGKWDERTIDDLYIRARNAAGWSRWERAVINTEPSFITALNTTGTAEEPLSWIQVLSGQSTQLPVTVTYSFAATYPQDGRDTGGVAADDFVPITAQARQAIREQISRIDDMLENIRYQEISDLTIDPTFGPHGMIRIHFYTDDAEDAPAAFAFFPSTAPNGGDIWINVFQVSPVNWGDGSGARHVFNHEFGHANGLRHPFLDSVGPLLPPETENNTYTSMSYTGTLSGAPNRVYGLNDIAALQNAYGASTTSRTENTLYSIPGYWKGSTDWTETLYDSGGIDTIDWSVSPFNDVIDLREGGTGRMGASGATNVLIAFGTVIENAIGGNGANTIIGNNAVNVLSGGFGNDDLTSYGGNDVMRGGGGDDTYRWAFGDHDDTIDEQAAAGRDRLEIGDFTGLGLNNFTEDFVFNRLGNDLVIDLRIDGGPTEGKITIKNQALGGSRVETLETLGVDVDLVDLFSKIAGVNQKFAIDFATAPSSFGRLVVPV
jgi:hypothetical protein